VIRYAAWLIFADNEHSVGISDPSMKRDSVEQKESPPPPSLSPSCTGRRSSIFTMTPSDPSFGLFYT
jgi:hypothetical protein